MNKAKNISKLVLKEATIWLLAGVIAFQSIFTILPYLGINLTPEARATVANAGRLYYGDSTNTGVVKFQTHTNPFTFNGEVSTAISTTSSQIAYIVAKSALTRNEMMIGQLKVDGRLDVLRCTGDCNAAGDFAAQWNNPGTTGAMTCTGTTPADCTRAFDLAYERLSGRTMVVYADTTAQKLYYCIWNGTSWSPVSNCAPTNGTNDISLTSNGRPNYVSLKPLSGTDEILMGVSVDVAGTMEVEAYRWSGSAWGNGVVATNTTNASTQGLEKGNVFDVEWESVTKRAFVIYATVATVEIKYKMFSSGSWGSETDAFDTNVNASAVSGLNSDADPVSDRIAVVTNDSANDISAGVWKANGSTDGWTSLTSSIGEAALENQTVGPPYSDVIWQGSGSSAQVIMQDTGTTADIHQSTISCNGSGCTATSHAAINSGSPTDDGTFVRLTQAPNSNELMTVFSDIDRNLIAQHWSGSAWETSASSVLEADVSGAGADTTIFHNLSAVFTYYPYKPWSLNWRWYNGNTDTGSVPTATLAAENAAASRVSLNDKIRLRINYSQYNPQGETDSRKKLQYTSGCTPNSSETGCTWSDVDDIGGSGIWRYVDLTCTPTDCADNTVLTGTVLTGTDASCSAGNGCGTWVTDKDSATTGNMDHNGSIVQESEYIIQHNGATAATTYYFRLYDVGDDSPVRREQDNDGSNDCSTAACTYPSLTTEGLEQSNYRWYNNTDTTDVGSTLAAQNTAATLSSNGDAFRLRELLKVNGDAVPVASWSTSSAETTNDVGNDSSIDAANEQVIFIAHRDSTNGVNNDLRFCKTTNQGVGWSCSKVDDLGTEGSHPSIDAVDANTVFISHRSIGSATLQFCKTTDQGSGWTCGSAEASNNGLDSSLKAISDQTIFISHHSSGGDLRFCKTTNQGTNWSCSSTGVTSSTGTDTSIDAIDDQTIFISYYISGNLGFCKTTNQGTNWSCSTVEDTSDTLASYNSIKAVSDQTIFISYSNSTSGNLRFCKTTNQGTNWSCSDVETNNDVGYFNSIDAVDTNTLFISHRDGTNTALRFCETANQGVTWSCSEVDATNDVGYSSSISVVSTGSIFISYHLFTSNDLRFAKLIRTPFKLQFATKSGTCDTGFSGEIYADVTTTSAIAYKDNTTPVDSAALTSNVNDPTGSGTIRNQTYEEWNFFTNTQAAVASGENGHWDFALVDNDGSSSVSYCFRWVKSDGTQIPTYTQIPEITTTAPAGPTTEDVMRHGNWFSSGVEQGFFWAN